MFMNCIVVLALAEVAMSTHGAWPDLEWALGGVSMKREPGEWRDEEAPQDLYLVLLVLLWIFSACSNILHLDPWRGCKPDIIIG